MQKQKTILIAAGGTGGHIYPGLALAKAFKSADPNLNVEFVGTAHGLENEIIPKENLPLHHLSIGRLNRNVALKERLMTLLKLPLALWQSFRLIQNKKPIAVIGVGGHASGPLLLCAAFLKTPSFIWEPNAYPGLANRILSKFVNEGWVVFDEANQILKMKNVKRFGMPVRKEIEDIKKSSRSSDPNQLNVLIVGGSQGARPINTVVADFFKVLPLDLQGKIAVVHQTGSYDFERVKEIYDRSAERIEVLPYLHDMQNRYQWADVVIARSGTGTLSELAAVGKASILIPLPTAADNHQQKNAEVFERAHAAVIIPQKDFNNKTLEVQLRGFLNQPDKIISMSQSAYALHTPKSAQKIADYLLHKV